MVSFLKKYWFFVLLGFIATILIVVNIFIPKESKKDTTPTPVESYKGITPGKTTTQELNGILGAPDPKQSDFSNNMLAYPREGGGPNHQVYADGNTVEFFKQQALEGNLSTYTNKHGLYEGEFYGDYQESGFKTYVWATKGIAVVASINNGYLFEVWYFKPSTMEDFLSKWGKNLTKESKQIEKY